MRMKVFAAIPWMLLLIGMPFRAEQEDIEKARQNLLKKIPIPSDAIALEKMNSFPDERESGLPLHDPCSLLIGQNAQIYLLDQAENCVHAHDSNGIFLRSFGRKGQGPGELLNPGKVVGDQDDLIVLDWGNSRIDLFDLSGKFKRSFRIFKSYRDCAVHAGRIYLTSMGQKDENLVDVLDFEGKRLFSFGDTRYDSYLLNWCKIAISQGGDVYLAFEHAPLVQRYTTAGRLLNEFRLKHPMTDIQENINLKQNGKRHSGPSLAAIVITSIVASNDGMYLLHDYPRTEIFFFDPTGRLKRTYWYENSNTRFCDMAVSGNPGGERFLLLDKNSSTVFVLGRKVHYR